MDPLNCTNSRPCDTRNFIHKRLLGAIGGGLTGGIGGAISGFASGGARTTPTPFVRPAIAPTPGVGAFIERIVPGGASGFHEAPVAVATHRGGATQMAVNAGTCAPKGFHKAKSTYTRKIDPCAPYSLSNIEIVPKGTYVEGASRRRNPSNGQANNRAISRLKGAEGQAVKLLKAVGYKAVSKNARRTR